MEDLAVDDLALVEWRDAFFDFQSQDEAMRSEYIVITIGMVVSCGDTFLDIASERLPNDDGHRAITHIPRPIILHAYKLTRGDEMSVATINKEEE